MGNQESVVPAPHEEGGIEHAYDAAAPSTGVGGGAPPSVPLPELPVPPATGGSSDNLSARSQLSGRSRGASSEGRQHSLSTMPASGTDAPPKKEAPSLADGAC
jgi:hypothetical protein